MLLKLQSCRQTVHVSKYRAIIETICASLTVMLQHVRWCLGLPATSAAAHHTQTQHQQLSTQLLRTVCLSNDLRRCKLCLLLHSQVAQVFQLVVEHCPSTKDPRVVCTLLQLSTDCRKTLQQTRGQCIVELDAVHVRRCSEFIVWLRSHPGLVKEVLMLEYYHPPNPCGCGYHLCPYCTRHYC